MRVIVLTLLSLTCLAAACRERKVVETRPDYGASQSASEKAHQSLDQEAGAGR
ncbi:MAG: hypothetical protein AAB036_11925 [Elusimicrobiota bacterium]